MITKEERDSIIAEAVEATLLKIPEVIGNLLVQHATLLKLTREFYEKHPDFAAHKPTVAAVLEEVEHNSVGLSFREVFDKAIPLIRERIKTVKSLDTKSIEKPKRDLSHLDLSHGDL